MDLFLRRSPSPGVVAVAMPGSQAADSTGRGGAMFWGWKEKPCLFLEGLIAGRGARTSVHIWEGGGGGQREDFCTLQKHL